MYFQLFRTTVHSVYYIDFRYFFTPINPEQDMLATFVHNELRLRKEHEARPITEPHLGKMSSLLYNFETELAREEFWMTGDTTAYKLTGYSPVPKKMLIEKYLKKVVRTMEIEGVNTETNHQIARIVEVVRMCNKVELDEILRHYFINTRMETTHEKIVRDVLTDALAIAGTKTTIDGLVELIEKEKIDITKAALAVKIIGNLRTPSVEIIETLLRFIKQRIVRENAVLRQSTMLTTGAVMNGFCGGHEQTWALELDDVKRCTREIKQEWLNQLRKMYVESNNRYEKILALKTIANAGLDVTVNFLKDIVHNKNEDLVIRLQAVDSMRLLRQKIPTKVQAVLMPIFMSRSQESTIRMAAVYQTMHSHPGRAVIDQIVMQLNREHNNEVFSFTFTLLDSFVDSKVPCEKKLSEDVTAALRLLLKRPVNLSQNVHVPLYSKLLDVGMTFDFSTVFGNDSALPQELVASMNTLIGGDWKKNLLQLGFSQQNLDKILNVLIKKIEGDNENLNRKTSMKSTLRNFFSDLKNKLNVFSRVNEDVDEGFGMIFLRHNNFDYAVVPVEEEMVQQFIERDYKMSELIGMLSKGYSFDRTMGAFVFEYYRMIPTALGLPLITKQKMPTVANLKGSFKLSISPKINIRLLAEPTLATTHVCSMMVDLPFVQSGVRMIHTMQTLIPVDFVGEYNIENNMIRTRIHLPKTNKKVMLVETRPLTFIRTYHDNIPHTNVKTVVLSRIASKNIHYAKTFGKTLLGLELEIAGTVQRDLIHQTPKTLLLGENHVELVVLPSSDSIKEIVFEFSPSVFPDRHLRSVNTRDIDEDFKTYDDEMESAEFEEKRVHAKKFLTNMELGQGLESTLIAKVYTVGGPQKIEGDMKLNTHCNKNLRICKLSVEIERLPMFNEKRNWKLQLDAEFVMPETPRSLNHLQSMKHKLMHGKFAILWGTDEDNKIIVNLVGEQDKEMNKLIQEEKIAKEGLYSYDRLVELARLNKYTFIVDHKLAKANKYVLDAVYNTVRSYYYMSSQILPVHHKQDNKLTITVTIDPVDRNRINFSIVNLGEKMVVPYFYLPIRLPLRSIAEEKPLDLIRNKLRAMCDVRTSRIQTFDNVLYRAPITTCFSVVAKDCSEEPEYVVMLRKVSEGSHEKILKIVTNENEIIVELTNDNMKCIVNGDRVERNLEHYGVTLLTDRVAEIVLNQLTVRFDGFHVRIFADRSEQNTMCGLCGHFDQHRENEFNTADLKFTGMLTKAPVSPNKY